MPESPPASVIIPCYNCERYLEETIQSVKEQTYPEVELVLVDDGSTDGTRAIIERHADEAVCHFGPNRGASAARTTGTELASGAYIQYLDADDRLRPDALEQRVAALEAESADVAYSQYQRLRPTGGGFVNGDVIEKTLEDVHPDPEIATFRQFWLPPVALTYSRRIVKKIGGWNEDLPVIQDARFLQDAAFHGGTFVKVDGVLGEYRDHEAGSLSTTDQRAFHRDIWVNARQIEERWRERQGRLAASQKTALAAVYDHCGRALFGLDRTIYTQAVHRIEELDPGALSDQLEMYRSAEKMIVYPLESRAEQTRQTVLKRGKDLLRPLYHAV
jgi:glycosyltransferase involved in cell wall biosynthesis